MIGVEGFWHQRVSQKEKKNYGIISMSIYLALGGSLSIYIFLLLLQLLIMFTSILSFVSCAGAKENHHDDRREGPERARERETDRETGRGRY